MGKYLLALFIGAVLALIFIRIIVVFLIILGLITLIYTLWKKKNIFGD